MISAICPDPRLHYFYLIRASSSKGVRHKCNTSLYLGTTWNISARIEPRFAIKVLELVEEYEFIKETFTLLKIKLL